MRNIKLIVEYDGTNYVGWQRQENGKSIQGEIESVLNQVLREKVNVIGAGRTDAGVHARGQVSNFRTESKLDISEIKGGLNGLLPDDIVIHAVEEVPIDFHARYSAKERQYSYLITKAPSALIRNYSWLVKYPLDVELMQQVTGTLIGKHDFESFCKANSDVDNHFCTVTSASWHQEGSLLIFIINADRFLHGMVRALVGTMIDVGRGYTSFEDFKKILEKKNRAEAGMSAPAKGLVLEKVIY
jgi:tRNA pseudouridine38-40 synthase